MNHTLDYNYSIRYPFRASYFKKASGICAACGAQGTFQYLDVINDALAQQWRISQKLQNAYSARESMRCSDCQCSARLRALAEAISAVYGDRHQSLRENIENNAFGAKKVAEINACGELHNILKDIEGLQYSEYGSRVPGVKSQDLQKLSYASGTFDLLLTSDTLEHIPDYNQALREIHRVLKPGGYHIFTVPLIFSRKTKRRAVLENGELKLKAKASYHGAGEEDNLVCTEFGIDFLNDLREANLQTHIYFGNPLNKNEVNYVLVSKKLKKARIV
jgi:SAM-dependent methyltransferase